MLPGVNSSPIMRRRNLLCAVNALLPAFASLFFPFLDGKRPFLRAAAAV
jgi:hypothetical protein